MANVKKSTFNDYCDRIKSRYDSQVVHTFSKKEQELTNHYVVAPYKPATTTATEDDLIASGHYYKQGLKEQWGLWLHHVDFNSLGYDHDPLSTHFKNEFAAKMSAASQKNSLIANPYYYILEGNEILRNGNSNHDVYSFLIGNHSDFISRSVSSYDKAIAMSPYFSLHAHFNKARALLTPSNNLGQAQVQAKASLEKARKLLITHERPTLLSLNNLLGDASGTKLSDHISCHINILGQQEQCIDKAISIINEANAGNYHVSLTNQSLNDALKDDKRLDYTSAISESRVHGLTNLFTLEVNKPIPWFSIIAVALLGIGQIIGGAFLMAFNPSFAYHMISEGISDVIAGVKAIYNKGFEWASWALQKAISYIVALVTMGIAKVKEAHAGC